ncbi:MAG: hypothetical protein K2G23_04030 [Muribaculaceae bacterium]|nr:hypothetical protein [Muribaculaceae bacterium]
MNRCTHGAPEGSGARWRGYVKGTGVSLLIGLQNVSKDVGLTVSLPSGIPAKGRERSSVILIIGSKVNN